MSDFLPKEVREGLEAARKKALRKSSRLRLKVGDEAYPILRMWENGMALDLRTDLPLRGLVDLYDGAKHLYQALIVATYEESHEMIYEFKRATLAGEAPALDYAQADDAPVALLTKS